MFRGAINRTSRSEVFCNKGENICARVSFLMKLQAEACSFIKKRDSDTGVLFPCQLCEIFKNTSFYRTTQVVTSE